VLSRERRLFFLRWLKNPLNVGVPVPSSRRLAKAIADQLAFVSPEEFVIELGPGTGVITRALLKAGIPQEKLIIIDIDDRFIEKLKHDLPKALILQGDARNLKEILENINIKSVAAVVSSLPLLAMPDIIRHAIVNSAFKVIKPDGGFIQYSYGLLSPLSKQNQKAIGIRGKIAKRVWRNFPPAIVWHYSNESCV